MSSNDNYEFLHRFLGYDQELKELLESAEESIRKLDRIILDVEEGTTINNATVTLANATTLNINGVSPTIASSSTGTLTLFNSNLLTLNAFGSATTATLLNAATTLTIGYASTAASTINISTGAVAASTIKTINIGTGGAASSTTNVNIGAIDGTLTLGTGTVVGTNTTQALFNTTATTLNIGGAATTLALGASTGTATTFTVTGGYNLGLIDVFVNGVKFVKCFVLKNLLI
jgi:hypothetical protein